MEWCKSKDYESNAQGGLTQDPAHLFNLMLAIPILMLKLLPVFLYLVILIALYSKRIPIQMSRLNPI